jgi:uncharacterized protein (TIGR03083 family)
VTPEDYLTALRREGDALAAAAEAHLSAPVPSCPGWTVATLVRHVGRVHRHKLATVDAGGTQQPDIAEPEIPDDDARLLSWYREGLDLLADRLAALDPQTPAYSWAGDHRVAFWQRRMAQETLVHRWDAQDGAGAPAGMDPELAADGVDEYLRVFLPDPEYPAADPTGTISVHATDVDRWWSLDTRQWPPDVRDGAAEADVTAAGTAEELLLVLWRRRRLSTVSVSGRDAVLRSMLDAADL